MSLATTRPRSAGAATDARAAIVEALRGIPTLTVSETAPVTPAPFCAWPRWALTTYTGARLGNVAAHEYDVLVLLPNGYEADTTAQGDALLAQVVAALWSVGVITTAQPAQVLFDAQQAMPALQVRVIPHIC